VVCDRGNEDAIAAILEAAEREAYRAALERHGGVIEKATRVAGCEVADEGPRDRGEEGERWKGASW